MTHHGHLVQRRLSIEQDVAEDKLAFKRVPPPHRNSLAIDQMPLDDPSVFQL
jgi:hypothetical protein